ncbi:MAG: DUF3576 domain-containing protein [Pseudomonadota bacterium]
MGRAALRLGALAIALVALTACSGNYAADDDFQTPSPNVGQNAAGDVDDTLFGEGGIALGRVLDGSILDGDEGSGPGGSLPVNRYLWQASLDTLSFLPLASTDPFTGVIATEWATTPENPDQRFKVTAYVLNHELRASALRVAVFREDRVDQGVWVPRAVSPDTARRLEDAILTRARQVRIASVEDESAS